MQREPKFSTGDIVTFKSRADIEREYSRIPYGFVTDMMYLCGTSCTVREVFWDDFMETYQILLVEDPTSRYVYSEEMFVDQSQFSLDDNVVATVGIGSLF